MEFRSNIIFSIIIHASIAVMTLVFAGRHVVLSHIHKNYIAVSLLRSADGKNSVSENRTRNTLDRFKESETKPQKTPPKNENKIASSEYALNDPLSERTAPREARYPDTDIKQTLEKISGQTVFPQDRPAGSEARSRDDHPSPTAVSSGEHAAGNTAGVTMIEMRSEGGGGNAQSIVSQIKASIERAKMYPVLARKRRNEGTVIAEFSINAKGYPQNIQIIKSSGFSLLDSAARDTIQKASPFPVIRGTIEVPLTFILKTE